MGRTWNNTSREVRAFERSLRKGDTVYAINDHATNLAGQFEANTYSAWTCTGRHAITGAMMFGTVSAKMLLCSAGQVFETPPRGFRDLASAEPDCRDQGLYGIGRGQEFKGNLDDGAEEMERLGGEARGRAKADKQAGRRSWW